MRFQAVSRRNKRMFIAGVAIFLLAMVIFGIFYIPIKEYTATVTDKDIKQYGKGSKYLIFTTLQDESIRVFSVEDNLFYLRFNSSDDYAKIQVGTTYKFRVTGLRIPISSMYENIVEITEIIE